MKHDHFASENVGKREAMEDLREQSEHLLRVLMLHLSLEAVDLVHAKALVVAAGKVEVIRVQHLGKGHRGNERRGGWGKEVARG